MEKVTESQARGGRLLSLDTLRGLDMLFIMGGASLVVAICSLFPGGADCSLAKTMGHVEWNGFAHHDTIFPLFLFIAGISFPYSYAKSCSKGMSRKDIYLKIVCRAAALIVLGMVYNGLLNLDFKNFRFFSVLGRIGVAWMFAAIFFINFKRWTRAGIAVAILVGYWLLLRFVPAPDMPGADPFSLEGNLVGYIDRTLFPGHLYQGIFDPEGLLSALPAIVTAMLGMFTGEFVRESKLSGSRKSLCMAGAALAMLIVGCAWGKIFPINKALWSSTFVLVAAAYSLFCFAILYYIVDVRKWQGWTLFFRVIGMNSITIYLAQRFINFYGIGSFFLGGIAGLCPAQWGAVILGIGYIAACWLLLYFLYRKNIFLKV